MATYVYIVYSFHTLDIVLLICHNHKQSGELGG